MNNTLRVAIVGCGTVGGATAIHLLQAADEIEERYGVRLQLVAVTDRVLDHARAIGLPEELLTENFDALIADGAVDCIVELVGGTDAAFSIIERSLRAGAHVVTANKALLAHRGVDLFRVAHECERDLAFEASCGGGIPLIRSLVDGLAGNRIDNIYGIVNGTCNYILSQMISRSISYQDALAEAQASGLAEADPALDVGGHDSAHKIAIMAALAFGVRVDYDSIPITGIDQLDLLDVSWATRLGYVPKLLAIAEHRENQIALRVRPSFVPNRHPLAWVSGPFNAISVYSYPTGHTMYYGRGAGGSATSGAVVADIVSVATGTYGCLFRSGRFWPDRSAPTVQNPEGMIRGRYYVRALVEDRPGVLAEMAERYGAYGISIASVHQDELEDREDQYAPVIIITHTADEESLYQAIDEINALSHVKEECVVISIIDEPAEQLIER
jgi:homoserine dehydrogenase